MNHNPYCHNPQAEDPEYKPRPPKDIADRIGKGAHDKADGRPPLRHMRPSVPPGGFDDHQPACHLGVDGPFVGWSVPRLMGFERVRLVLLWGMVSRDPFGGTRPPNWVCGLTDDGRPTQLGPDPCNRILYQRKDSPFIRFP